MNTKLYEAIFKRKSFHLFLGVGSDTLSQDDLDGIEAAYDTFDALYPDIKTAIRIIPAANVNFKRDAEYCILIYSEKRPNYLLNAGYIGQQLDLWLVSHDIGSLWYGIGKPDMQKYEDLDFVIMLAIRKVTDAAKYRKDMFKAKRKELSDVWSGDTLGETANIARFAPSACNTQPWYIENNGGALTVYRYRKPGKRSIMPAAKVAYFNRIDIGIYLCILELCMQKNDIKFEKELFTDDGGDEEYTKVAVYKTERR